MRVVYGITAGRHQLHKPVIAIGIFDGVHRGHRYLMGRMCDRARCLKRPSVVMTFSPHPHHIVKSIARVPLLVPLDARLQRIAQLGVDACIVIPFTKKFSQLTPSTFIARYVVVALEPTCVFVGAHFRFGKNQTGTVETLRAAGRRHGFSVIAVSRRKLAGRVISSTRVRSLIASGSLPRAAKLLGRPVSCYGKVVRGRGRGRRLGFPTVNINPANAIIPPPGIYAARIIAGAQAWNAMAYIGRRPSFEKPHSPIIVEAHAFGYCKNLYGKNIEIQFFCKTRGDITFPNRAQLIAQLHADKQKIRTILVNIL